MAVLEGERRDPARQAPRPDGERDTDPILTTRMIADKLGTTTQFVVDEIKAGRLHAKRHDLGGRPMYRVQPVDYASYYARHWTAAFRA